MRAVTDKFFVSPQIAPGDAARLAAEGFTLLINNRPDGEAPGQPSDAAMREAAREAGLAYRFIPITAEGLTPDRLDAFERAGADAAAGKTLAYCASGTRSVLLRSYAEARFGKPADLIIEEAARAGFDIAAHRPALESLADAQRPPRTDPPV